MARDDSILHTGITSASYTKRDVANQEKIEKQGKITPAAKILFDLIEKEKVNAADIRSLILSFETSQEDIKSELLARKMYTAYLTQLQGQLRTILRAKPRRKHD